MDRDVRLSVSKIVPEANRVTTDQPFFNGKIKNDTYARTKRD